MKKTPLHTSKHLAITLALAAVTATSCARSEESKSDLNLKGFGVVRDANSRPAQTVDLIEIKNNKKLSTSQKAELIAKKGELMMTPTDFMHADEAMSLALSIDNTNARAKLYKAMLKPLMSVRGVFSRIKPLIKNESPDNKEAFAEALEIASANKPVYNFMTDGSEDIKDEAGVQGFVDGFGQAQTELREFFKNNKDLDLRISFPIVDTSEATDSKDVWSVCQSRRITKGLYVLSACPFYYKAEIGIERADIEALQHIAAGLQMYTILATAYDLTGVREISNEVKRGWNPTKEDIVYYFNSVREFGWLRSQNQLAQVTRMGSDILAGAKWAHNLQSKLCPNGRTEDRLRPGKLFSSGVCVRAEETPGGVTRVFDVVETALAGQSLEIFARGQETHVTALSHDIIDADYLTVANILAPVQNPVANMKTLFPTEFDQCGAPTNVGDSTLGGLLPSGDAQTYLTVTGAFESGCQ